MPQVLPPRSEPTETAVLPSLDVVLAASEQPDTVPGLLQLERVSKSWPADQGERPCGVHDLSFVVSPGEFVFLVGQTGAGKTTCLRLLHGALAPDEGQVLVGGKPLSGMSLRRYRQRVGLVAQTLDTMPGLTLAENIALPLEYLGWRRRDIRERVDELLANFGLEHRRDSLCAEGKISGGERQRLAIARAVAHRPQLLLCDEPTGQLDLRTSYGVMRLLNHINMSGTTVICVTHDPAMVNLMRKRVIALADGSLVHDQVGGYPFS